MVDQFNPLFIILNCRIVLWIITSTAEGKDFSLHYIQRPFIDSKSLRDGFECLTGCINSLWNRLGIEYAGTVICESIPLIWKYMRGHSYNKVRTGVLPPHITPKQASKFAKFCTCTSVLVPVWPKKCKLLIRVRDIKIHNQM